jgi:5'-nucleotidase
MSDSPPRVLVTNDDGIDSPGLHALARGVVSLGYDVVIVAPDRDMSGTSSSMAPFGAPDRIDYTAVPLDGLDGVAAYALAGPPALCVIAAALGGFGEPPALVVSGVNPGLNTGRSTLHSGTVGAALTAANWGLSGLAVSVATRRGSDPRWDTAVWFAQAALGSLAAAPARTAVNLNVPDLAVDDVRGIRSGDLAPYGAVRTVISHHSPGSLHLRLQPTEFEIEPHTDTALVAAGYVCVTPLAGPRALLDAAGGAEQAEVFP